jgi:hypothetical protein
MKNAAFTLFLLIYSFSAFCQLKYTQNLKNVARISFPDTPKLKPLEKNIWLYHYSGEREMYFVQISPLKKSLRDLFTDSVNYKLYNGFIEGTLGSTKSDKSKLFFKKQVLVDSLEGQEYFYTIKTAGKKFYSYNRIVFFNDTLINFSIWSLDSLKRTDKNIGAYFKSFKVTIPDNDIVSQNETELAHRSGYFIGMLTFIAIPLFIIAVIVLLIKKFGGFKQKKQWSEDDFR